MTGKIVSAASLLAAGLLAGCGEPPVAPATVAGSNVSTGFVSGNHDYDTVCGQCHETGVGPMLRGRQLPAAATSLIVRTGLSAMPAFPQSALSDEQLAAVASFIETSEAPETQEQTDAD